MRRRRTAATAAVVLAAVGLGSVVLPAGRAVASWLASGPVTATAYADALGAGQTPAAAVAGRTATVTWAASTLATSGLAAGGYEVTRLDGGDDDAAVTCAAPAELLRCVEHGLPVGSWRYRVVPTFQQWTGGASAPSAAVTVAAPSFTIAAGQQLRRGDAVAGGALANFDVGETVQLLLDGAGSPLATVTVGADGTVGSLAFTVPAGATGGAHTVSAVGSLTTAVSASFTVLVDDPVISSSPSGTAGSNGWYLSSVAVGLLAVDGSGLGLASFTYSLDGGGAVTVSGTTTTVTVASEGEHSLAATATDQLGHTGQHTVTVKVDLAAPIVPFSPPSHISRQTPLIAAVTDTGSGAASVRYDACAGGACTPAAALGTSTSGPSYGLTWPTGAADGTYRVLAVGTDVAGRSTTTATHTVVLDDTAPTASLTAPASGAVVGGPAVTFSASVADAPATWAANGADVQFEYRLVGAPTWSPLLDPAGSASTGTADLTAVADGSYEFRATATDLAGNGASTAARPFTVQNWAANTVATTNGFLGTVGRMDGGDTIVITFTRAMAVSSFCSTWSNDNNSQSVPATVTVTDGGASADVLTMSSGSCTMDFGSLDLGATGYAGSGGSTFSATASWAPGSKTLTISLALFPAGSVTTESVGGRATYTPSTSLLSSAGVPIDPAPKQTAGSGRQF